jgi:hypothetical protein
VSALRASVWLAAAVAAAGAGCITTKQRVEIACVPRAVSIYVDGRLLEPDADSVLLRTDRPHKIFVKGPGYEPQLVVLQPERDAEGRLRFATDDVCIEVAPIGQSRALELEPERDIEVPERP